LDPDPKPDPDPLVRGTDPDPLVRGTDPDPKLHQNFTDPQHSFHVWQTFYLAGECDVWGSGPLLAELASEVGLVVRRDCVPDSIQEIRSLKSLI
jgi:hypothetical protein